MTARFGLNASHERRGLHVMVLKWNERGKEKIELQQRM